MLVYLPTPCTYITKSFNVMKMMRWNEPATLAVKVLDVMLRQDIEFHQRRWSLVCWLTCDVDDMWIREGEKKIPNDHPLSTLSQAKISFLYFLALLIEKDVKRAYDFQYESLAAIHTVISKNRKLKPYSYCKRWFWTKISSDNGP